MASSMTGGAAGSWRQWNGRSEAYISARQGMLALHASRMTIGQIGRRRVGWGHRGRAGGRRKKKQCIAQPNRTSCLSQAKKVSSAESCDASAWPTKSVTIEELVERIRRNRAAEAAQLAMMHWDQVDQACRSPHSDQADVQEPRGKSQNHIPSKLNSKNKNNTQFSQSYQARSTRRNCAG